jgi:hypothetical protein
MSWNGRWGHKGNLPIWRSGSPTSHDKTENPFEVHDLTDLRLFQEVERP